MISSRSLPQHSVETAVELRGVARRFGGVPAVDGIDLVVRRGEFFSLLGPSGCGKTTLLRMVAGLDLPDEGRVHIGGRDATTTPAHQRSVNTVFQSYALFPHLTVRENVEFGLRMKKVPRAESEERVRRVMELAHLADLGRRYPSQLSGGQKQRVALARAIVNEPEVLLLDEPLGALDLKLRKQLQAELHGLQRRLGITFIYVTHDQEEALAMSDRIAVMNAGKIEQIGSPKEIYERPSTKFVAQFVGASNLIPAIAIRKEGPALFAQTALGEIRVELNANLPSVETGRFTLAIRPEKARVLAESDAPACNCFKLRVLDVIYSGAGTEYVFESEVGPLKISMLNAQVGRRELSAGDSAVIYLPPAALVVL